MQVVLRGGDVAPPFCDHCAFTTEQTRREAIHERIFDAWHDKQWTGTPRDYLVSYSNYLMEHGWRLPHRPHQEPSS